MQYAYTRTIHTAAWFWRTPAYHHRIVPCRARINGEVLVGQVLLPSTRQDALHQRCYIAQPHGMRAEKRFDVLAVQVPKQHGASACTAHCQGQVDQVLAGSIDLYTDGRIVTPDAGSCCALCRATYGCAAFVHHLDGSGRCELKAHVTPQQASSVADLQHCAGGEKHAALVGGVVREAAAVDTGHCVPVHSVYNNRAYHGPMENATTEAAATLATCCHRCKEHSLCRTFTWHKVLHTCVLQLVVGEAVTSLQHVSGRLR